jgi:hypothetical protein
VPLCHQELGGGRTNEPGGPSDENSQQNPPDSPVDGYRDEHCTVVTTLPNNPNEMVEMGAYARMLAASSCAESIEAPYWAQL